MNDQTQRGELNDDAGRWGVTFDPPLAGESIPIREDRITDADVESVASWLKEFDNSENGWAISDEGWRTLANELLSRVLKEDHDACRGA